MRTGRTQDLINALAASNSTLAEMYNEKKKQEAEIRLNAIQRQFTKDSTKKLFELKNNPNYEQWPEIMDSFLSEISGSLNKKIISNGEVNPYYCQNDYEAKKAMDMLNSQYVQLQKQMIVMSLERLDQNNVVSAMTTIDGIIDDDTLPTQSKLNEANKTLEQIRPNLTPEQYKQEQYTRWYEIVSGDYTTFYEDTIDAALSRGETWSKVKDHVDKNFNYEDYDIYDQKGNKITKSAKSNYRTQFKTIEKNMETLYKTKLAEIQEENRSTFSSTLTDINNAITNGDYVTAAAWIKKGNNDLQKTKGTIKLSNSDQERYAELFSSKQRQLEALIDNDEKKANKEVKTQVKTEIENESKNLSEKVRKGEISPEVAKEALNEYVEENYTEDAEELKEKYSHIFDGLFRNALDYIWNDKRFFKAKNAYEQIVKEVEKDPNAYDMHYINSALIDLTSGVELDDIDPDQFINQMNKIKNNVFVQKFEKLNAGGMVNNGQFIPNTKTKDIDEWFKQMTAAAEESDPVYSDENGIHYSSPAAENAVKQYAGTVKDLVIDSIGEENIPEGAEIKVNLMRDESGDETARPVIEVPHYQKVIVNGKVATSANVVTDRYHLEATKNKNGKKVTGYKIVDENGNELAKVDYKALEKIKKKQGAQNLEQLQAQTQKAIQESERDLKRYEGSYDAYELDRTLNSKINVTPQLEAALGIMNHTKEDWNKASAEEKRKWIETIQRAVIENRAEAKSYLKALGLKKEDLVNNPKWWNNIIWGKKKN